MTDYTTERNKLIGQAEAIANRKCGWEYKRRSKILHSITKCEWSKQWNREYFRAMDSLSKKAGI